jgi:hypothetical protein
MRYGIWCEVFGGVTGHRQSWLKENGQRVEYDNAETAAREALRLDKQSNGNPYRTANFSYAVRQLDGETT